MRSRRLSEIRERVLRTLEALASSLGCDVYLFGSMARGDHLVDSDVDIVVVHEGFAGKSIPERVEAVRKLLPGDMGFDIIPLTPEEFEERLGRSPVLREASRYWIKITRRGDSQREGSSPSRSI